MVSEELDAAQVARLDERLEQVGRAVDSLLLEFRELSKSLTGAGGYGERLHTVELKLEGLEKDVLELAEAEKTRHAEARAAEKVQRAEGRAVRNRILVGIVVTVVGVAITAWFAGAGS